MVNLAFLETIIVNVRTVPGAHIHEPDHDLEDRVLDALAKLDIVYSGEPLRLKFGAWSGARPASPSPSP